MLRPLSFFKKLSVFLLVYLSVNTVMAQVYTSSISAGSGGTGRAAVEPGDALLLNPASLPHLKGRFIFTSFAEDEFAASLSDNTQESALPAGFSYVQKKSSSSLGDLKNHDLSVTLAELVGSKWSLGITGHYLEQWIPDKHYIQWNGDVGLLFAMKENFGFAIVAYNVLGEDTSIPKEIREKFTYAGALNYIYNDSVRLRADVTSESLYEFGAEAYFNRFVLLRLGYSTDTDDERDLMTFGIGFAGPKFIINYAYQANTQKSGDYRHSVDLVIPF